MSTNDRWSQLSIQQRADLIKLYVNNGITDLGSIRKSYNGIPYASFNSSEYDYFGAAPENEPSSEGEHWTSRNPHTEQLLKREDHPTYDLMIQGEKEAGYNVYRGLDGNLYSSPKEPTNYVEDVNILKNGGNTVVPVGEGQKTYNHPKYNHAEEQVIYSYLRDRGVPHIQASAIMGNIAVESMLNPEISQIGGSGGYGLIQATDRSRKNNFINYDGQPYVFGSKLNPETQRQLDYIIDKGLDTYTIGEWRGNENISKARVARQRFLEADSVKKASKIFMENYLRPGKPHEKRRTSMSNYFHDKYATVERALEEFSDKFLYNGK